MQRHDHALAIVSQSLRSAWPRHLYSTAHDSTCSCTAVSASPILAVAAFAVRELAALNSAVIDSGRIAVSARFAATVVANRRARARFAHRRAVPGSRRHRADVARLVLGRRHGRGWSARRPHEPRPGCALIARRRCAAAVRLHGRRHGRGWSAGRAREARSWRARGCRLDFEANGS